MPRDGSCHKNLKKGTICDNCEVVVGSPEDNFKEQFAIEQKLAKKEKKEKK